MAIITLDLTDEEFAALRRFRDEDAKGLSRDAAAHLLLRDHLIGLGLLKLGKAKY